MLSGKPLNRQYEILSSYVMLNISICYVRINKYSGEKLRTIGEVFNVRESSISEAGLEVRLVSFKGSLQALRNWEPHLNQAKISNTERFRLVSDLYDAMTNTPIRQRPGRSEPRCIKRRPKSYQLLTAPRHEMKEVPHRNRYHATNP